MFKEKKKLKKIFYIRFQVCQDPRQAVVDDGYASIPPGLKCFKGKKKKKILRKNSKFGGTHAKPSLTTAMLQPRRD
jgi:hypothetical protein